MLTDYYCDASFKCRVISSRSFTDDSVRGWRSVTVEWFSLVEHGAEIEVQSDFACSKDCVNMHVETDSLLFKEIGPGNIAEIRRRSCIYYCQYILVWVLTSALVN